MDGHIKDFSLTKAFDCCLLTRCHGYQLAGSCKAILWLGTHSKLNYVVGVKGTAWLEKHAFESVVSIDKIPAQTDRGQAVLIRLRFELKR